MAGFFRLVACLLVILLSGTPVFGQIPAEFIPPPLASTMAALPLSCNEGEVRRLSDGDVKGAIVQCDDNETWHCQDYYSDSVYNWACPPWKAVHTAADNSTAIQAAITDAIAAIAAGKRPTLFSPGDYVYTVTSTLDWNSGSSTSALAYLRCGGQGGIQFNFLAANGYGLRFRGDGVVNQIRIDNCSFTGGGANTSPDNLVSFEFAAQVYLNNVGVGDMKLYGFRPTIVSHFKWDGGICAENTVHDAGGRCIFLSNTAASVHIKNVSIEGAPGTNLSFIGLNSGPIGRLNVIGNHSTGELQSFIKADAGTAQAVDAVIIGNMANNLTVDGVDLCSASTGSNLNSNIVIEANIFRGIAADAATGYGVCVWKPKNLTVTNNVLADFNNGVSLQQSVDTAQINNNQIINAEFSGIINECNSNGCTIVNQDIRDNYVTAQVEVYKGDSGAPLAGSLGQNRITGTILGDAATRALATPFNWNGGFTHATDVLQYADLKQTETCTTTGDVNVATKSAKPYYANVQIDNDDDDGGCDFTLTTTGALEGARVRVTLLETAGGTVRVASASTDAIVLGDVFDYQFQNGAWRKIN